MSIATMKQALEALENNKRTHYYCEDTWYSCPKHEEGCANNFEGDECNCGADKANAEIDASIIALRQAIAEAEKQEPFGYFRYDIRLGEWIQSRDSDRGVAFYTHPPKERAEGEKREWVGLTNEEMYKLWPGADEENDRMAFGKAVETKLKEKNT